MIIFLWLITFSNYYAYRGHGDYLHLHPKSLALAEADLAVAIHNFASNPSLVTLRRGITFSTGLNFYIHEEDRRIPLYDRYNNTIGYSTYYHRTNNYLEFSPTFFIYSLKNFGIGLGYDKPVDFNYKKQFTRRTDSYVNLEKIILRSKGGIEKYSLGIGGNLKRTYYLGISLNYLHGIKQVDSTVIRRDTLFKYQTELTHRGTSVNVGFLYFLRYKLKIGLSYETSWGDENLGKPEILNFGLEFVPRAYYTTKTYFLIRWLNFSSLSEKFKEKLSLSVGLDQNISPEINLLMGLSLQQKDEDDGYQVKFGFGGEYTKDFLKFHVGFGILPIRYTLTQDLNYSFPSIHENVFAISFGMTLIR